MDQLEGLKRQINHAQIVNRVIGGRQVGKRHCMNQLAVAGVNAGKTVAICQREGIISFKPFGDYVEIKFSEYERP